jgi:AcrR family transcriptional regulator
MVFSARLVSARCRLAQVSQDVNRPGPAAGRRPHAGRRRNELARQAVLEAALRLLREQGYPALSMEALARAAGVGKHTLYRWWPSKAAVVAEAAAARAAAEVPVPDSGALAGDLEAFLTATFRAADHPEIAPVLRTLAAEAQRDPAAAQILREFTAGRRRVLRELLERGNARGQLRRDVDIDLLVDAAYGVFWYRFLVGHRPPDAAAARGIAALATTGVTPQRRDEQ